MLFDVIICRHFYARALSLSLSHSASRMANNGTSLRYMHLYAVVHNLHVPIAAPVVVNSRRRKKTIDNCINPIDSVHARSHSLTHSQRHTRVLATNCLIYCRRKINEYAAADGSRKIHNFMLNKWNWSAICCAK